MAKKLFVGSLPWATTSDELKELFSQAGTVSSATIISDKMTGRSRGFGFVEFDNDEEADAAVAMFNGKEFGGRNLLVNEARPMADRPPRRSFGGGGDRGGHGGRRDDNY
jgi:RNA recognition motif-containing protein